MDAADPAVASRNWRFSLRSVLLAFAAVCLLLAPYHWFGALYVISASFSFLLVLVCALTYGKSAWAAVFLAGGGLFFGFVTAVVFIVFFLHAFFNCLASAVCAAASVKPRAHAICLLMVMTGVYGFAIAIGGSEVRELLALKKEYPLGSLTPRLSFEHETTRNASPPDSSIQLASAVVKSLNDDELRFQQYDIGRPWALEQLHDNATQQFARAAGFGIMRMPSIRPELVQLEPRPQLALPLPIAIAPFGADDPKFTNLHRAAVASFIDADRVGYVRNRREAAGFESHRLASLKEDYLPAGRHNWQVTRLELVSLLRHEEPRVYVTEPMPPMDQLSGVPTRTLSKFERQALLQLVAQKDVVVDAAEHQIAMMGALRASTACLQCHEGERGKLLGAFSYELVPLQTPNETTPATKVSLLLR